MARSFSLTPERILGLKDGLPWYDSRDYPVQFFPTSDVIQISVDVNYPDFIHANSYGFAAGDTGGGVIRQSCSSYVTIPFQDWGPSDQPGITNDLPDEVIGTMPGDADVALVRVKGVRTNAPDQVLGNTVPVAFEENVWTAADGGTVLMEMLFPVVRMMWIRFSPTLNMDGTRNIILTRKQSIRKITYTHWRSGNSPLSTGWTFGGTNGRYGHMVKHIESKGPTIAPGGVITYRRGDGSQCSLTDSSDYSSSYDMDIEITPGRSDIASDSSGGGSGLGATSFDYVDSNSIDSGGGSTHTYLDLNIGTPPEGDNTRHVLVSVMARTGSGISGAKDLTGVTVEGVAASQVLYRRFFIDNPGSNDSSWVVTYYIISVPTGTTADIVLSFNAVFTNSLVDLFSIYNLPSTIPGDTISLDFNTSGTNSQGIDVTANGSLFTLINGGGVSALSGISAVIPADGLSTWRGFESIAASATRNIVITNNGSPGVWIAAAFAGRPGKAYLFTDSASAPGVSPPVFSDLYIGDAPNSGETRYVVAVFTITDTTTSANADMGTVTLNGVAMTLLRKERANANAGKCDIMAVYGLSVSSGTEGDFVFNITGATAADSFVDVYALYNLASFTPVDIEAPSAGALSFSTSMNTGAFGFGIALGVVYDLGGTEPTITLDGFENTSSVFDGTANGRFIRSYGVTEAGTQAIGMTTSYGANRFIWMTFN